MSNQLALQSSSSASASTTQLNHQTLTFSSRSSRNSNQYTDLTLNLISNLSSKPEHTSGLGRDYWLEDSSATKCRSCDRKFTTFRRKHHCRICGKIFCGACTTFIDGSKFNYNGKMRVCLLCDQLADKYEEDLSSEDESILDDPYSTYNNANSTNESIKSTKNNHKNNKDKVDLAPTPPPMMAIATTRKGEAVEIDIPRTSSVTRKTRTTSKLHQNPFFITPMRNNNDTTPSRNHNNNHNNNGSNYNNNNINSNYNNLLNNSSSNIFSFNDLNNDVKKSLAPSLSSVAANAASLFHFGDSNNNNTNNNNDNALKKSKSPNRFGFSLYPNISNTTPSIHSSSSLAHDSDDNSNILAPKSSRDVCTNSSDESSEDENEMISFMNNHQFNWPYRNSTDDSNNGIKNKNTVNNNSNNNNNNNSSNGNNNNNNNNNITNNNNTIFSKSTSAIHNSFQNPSFSNLKSAASTNLKHLNTLSSTKDGLKNPTQTLLPRRSNRRRAFKRLKNRRMSKSGSARIPSDFNSSNIFNRVVSTSSGFGFGSEDFEFMDDFLRAGENHSRQLLKELLTDKQVENIDEWTAVLIKCLKKISCISLNISNSSSFDMTNYLKLKKIPGCSIDDTQIIDGVVFSKNLPLKTMPREITNPSIMLITFPVEYDQDVNQHYSSLEPVIAQQDEYLKKLVGRIVALKPNIVLSTSSVNGYALKLLADSGISVAFEVKYQVIQRLSRVTEADIITSIDKLAVMPKLGKCGKFEVRTYLHLSIKRTYFYFTGCNPELGFTVVLRGSTKDNLNKIKGCAALMVYAFFNVKLESGLMRDQCLHASEYIIKNVTPALYTIQLGSVEDIWKLVDERILSSSPWVKFNVPFVLSQIRKLEKEKAKNEEMWNEFVNIFSKNVDKKEQIKEIKSSDDCLELKELNRSGNENKFNYVVDENIFDKFREYWKIKHSVRDLPNNYKDLYKLVETNMQFKKQYLGSELSIVMRQWDQFWSIRKLAFFDPNYHQNIVTLFSMVSTKNATPCIGPEIQLIDFYWENDFCLGQFIEHICLHADDICTEGCGLTLKEHFRSYVHGSGKVDVVVENNSHVIQGKENIIMSWSYCKICHNNTAMLPLSDNAWKYSFGKYLELSFWCRGMTVKGATCPHDFYRDQIHYFSFQDSAVRVEYSSIETLILIPPKFQLFWEPEYDVKIKLDTYRGVLDRSMEFFESVRSRLKRVKLDSMSRDNMEAGEKRISELNEKLEKEQNEVILLSKHIYDTSDVTDHMTLNAVIREVQELSSEWNFEFQDFARDFLPSEKDIKKITAFQLDKLFKSVSGDEKDKKKDNENEESLDEKKIVNEKERKVDEDDIIKQSNTTVDSDDLSNDTDTEGKIKSRKKGQLVLDKINELNSFKGLNKSLPIEKRLEIRSPKSEELMNKKSFWETRTDELTENLLKTGEPIIPDLDAGKVKKLTKFFDAQEFFKQREREKKEMERMNSYMPKVSASKPRIEIYKNVNDAVQAEGRERSGLNGKGNPKSKDDGNDVNRSVSKDETTNEEDDKRKDDERRPDVQPEKVSLLKSLAHFWADRSASLWEPLNYPLTSSEHIFVDSDVIVREDEPSSIIAFCLSTSDYSSKLYSTKNQSATQLQDIRTGTANANNTKDNSLNMESAVAAVAFANNLSVNNFSNNTDFNTVSESKSTSKDDNVPFSISSSQLDNSNDEDNENEKSSSVNNLNLEEIMLKKGFHLKYQFEEGCSTISCKIFFAEQFDALRRECNVNDNFIQSLSRCVKWDSTGGKSGSAFLKTLDNRFVIKELSKAELEAFVQFAPNYFEYFAQALFHGLPTVLVKIFGFYQIQVKNTIPGAKSYTMDILIMENLFYNRKMDRIFDLKGSMRNRHVEQTGKENEVLLDENMVEYIYESPLFVRENAKRLLRASLWNDTLFLAKMNVMDYSLVVGIDSENKELVVGIIDCIRTFTWDKKLESWVKEKGLVGGSGVGKEPTVITPKQYKNRFREAMERYILMAPGAYYQGTT